MLQISDAALTLLREALEVERTNEEQVFRLDLQDDQFVLGLQEPQDDDVQFEYDGSTVLATSSVVANDLLGGSTIDLESTADGPRLVLLASEG